MIPLIIKNKSIQYIVLQKREIKLISIIKTNKTLCFNSINDKIIKELLIN